MKWLLRMGLIGSLVGVLTYVAGLIWSYVTQFTWARCFCYLEIINYEARSHTYYYIINSYALLFQSVPSSYYLPTILFAFMLFLSGIFTAVGFLGFNRLTPSEIFWINSGSQAACYSFASFYSVFTIWPSFMLSNALYFMHPTFWAIGRWSVILWVIKGESD